jgi:hypothetical protein
MNKTIITVILIFILVVVLYQFAPGGGWQGDGTPLYTIAQGCVNGGVYVKGGHGLTYEIPYIEYFDVPDGEVVYARLYIPVWNYKPGDTLDLTLNGNSPKISSEPDYTAAWGVTGYSCNVTDHIIPSMNEVQVVYDNPNGGPYCVMLVVVYEDPDMPPVHFWINEGNHALAYKNNIDTSTTTFTGCIPGTDALLYTLLIAGTEGEVDELYFDSLLIGSDVGRSNSGKYIDLDVFNVTLTEQVSEVRFERGDEGYLHPFTCVLVAESGSQTDCNNIEIYEMQAVKENSIPISVIAVCLIVIVAVVITFLRRKKNDM